MEIEQSELTNPLLLLFNDYCKEIEQDQLLRENIKKVVKEIELLTRQQTAILSQLHNNPNRQNELCAQTKKFFVPIKNHYQELQNLIKDQFFKYVDHFRFTTSQIVFISAYLNWLESGKLISISEIESLIGFPGKSPSNVHAFRLELEDYLLGLCNLPSELSRLAVNSVVSGNYDRPLQIQTFVSDLYNGFRLLNLKNDSIRKRYDSIKYDMKKIEEVVYDIKIRGLVTQQ